MLILTFMFAFTTAAFFSVATHTFTYVLTYMFVH